MSFLKAFQKATKVVKVDKIEQELFALERKRAAIKKKMLAKHAELEAAMKEAKGTGV